jgi:hypothetical protein
VLSLRAGDDGKGPRCVKGADESRGVKSEEMFWCEVWVCEVAM